MFHNGDDLMMVTPWTETARLIMLYRVLAYSIENSEIIVISMHQKPWNLNRVALPLEV
jgi:hypothetical protein